MDNGYRSARGDEPAEVLLRGRRCRVLSVSAEYTVLDVTAVPDAAVGDVVTVIGEDGSESIAVEDVARQPGRPERRVLDGRPAQRPLPLRRRLTVQHTSARSRAPPMRGV